MNITSKIIGLGFFIGFIPIMIMCLIATIILRLSEIKIW